ncbi:hypothetical protein CI109_102847 [Kwoniella shandongensis]|uniref:Uncharacterized protein n=1 Tax=Kwoniella shandongensis TaxID=1734106 RepID=A0A5M6CDJ3_9TREE|nr:uncharacterized protein CI109_000037 [Kwoniella shandongensis]KAA5531199.1 hypothetical protein CI109_000037 [Kwoniella shandongensis]
MVKSSSLEPLLPHNQTSHSRSSKTSIAVLISLFGLLTLLSPSPLSILTSAFSHPSSSSELDSVALRGSCGQAKPILPPSDQHNISSVWEYKDEIVKWHQGAIKIPTEVFDEMGEPGEDKRWDIFADFHKYLEKAYPLVHKHLQRTVVDTTALVYEWVGTDESLKPLFLTAHQDVVPVLPDTVYQWEQPPFGAVYDGTYIWGRGSNDDKSGLTAVMASIELLLSTSDFKPRRTIILGFGSDEEAGGQRGAPAIRDWLLEKYGADSFSLIVDEGSGMQTVWGQTFGLPAVAEKGKLNLNLTVSTLGGHSSVPPPHTNIGLTARLITALEDNPNPIELEKKSPIWGFLQCAAGYAADIPESLKESTVKSIKGDKKAFKELPETFVKAGLGESRTGPGQGNGVQSLLSTTQAVDIINGGVKVNALPEVVTTIVNYRIDVSSSVQALQDRIFSILQSKAEELSLSISGFGHSWSPPSGTFVRGSISLTPAFEEGLDPAPISPTDLGSAAWRLLAGTSRGVYASRPEVSKDGKIVDLSDEEGLVMAPFMSTGNTDTRRYWDFTNNIYRWRYFPDEDGQGAHTINERISADALVEFVRFYQALILVVDASNEV